MVRPTWFLAMGVLAAFARGPRETVPGPETWSVRYAWADGTVAPRYYHEIAIGVSSGGEGWMEMIPTYPGEGVPAWRDSFAIAAKDLEGLRALLEERVVGHEWRAAEMDQIPVGGSSESLAVRYGDRRVEVPAWLAPEDDARIEPVYEAIRGLVPERVRGDLQDRRDAWIARRYPD